VIPKNCCFVDIYSPMAGEYIKQQNYQQGQVLRDSARVAAVNFGIMNLQYQMNAFIVCDFLKYVGGECRAMIIYIT